MGGIFINYRRHPDRAGFIDTLFEQLSGRFGSGNVFLDVTSMSPGERYPNRLRRHLDCPVVDRLTPITQKHTIEGLVMGDA